MIQPTYTINRGLYKFGNIDWELLVKANSVNGIFTGEIFLELKCLYENRELDLWTINAEIRIKGQTLYDKFERNVEFCFSSTAKRLNFGKVADRNRFRFSPPIVRSVSLFIDIKSSVLKASDFSIPKNDGTGIVLRLGGHKLYVDRCALISIESRFRGMLTLDKYEIELNGVDLKYFVIFLQLLHQQKQRITTENVYGLIAIAKQYEIQFLMAACEDFLISTENLTPLEKLLIAERYQFSKLQTNILERLTMDEIIELVEKIEDKDGKTLQALLEKKSEIMKKGRAGKRINLMRRLLYYLVCFCR